MPPWPATRSCVYGVLVVDDVEQVDEELGCRLADRPHVLRAQVDLPHAGLSNEPTESGASQRSMMPPKRNASAVGTRNGRLRPDDRNVRLAIVPEFHENGAAELQAERERVRAAALGEVTDQAGLRAELVRRARIEEQHVALEVGVAVGVGVALGVRSSCRTTATASCWRSACGTRTRGLEVALAAGERAEDEVRARVLGVAEVVVAEEQRVRMRWIAGTPVTLGSRSGSA